jgi:hypothetical protein
MRANQILRCIVVGVSPQRIEPRRTLCAHVSQRHAKNACTGTEMNALLWNATVCATYFVIYRVQFNVKFAAKDCIAFWRDFLFANYKTMS